MNKNLIIACVMAVFAITANAQTFTDSFESYSAGSYLAKSSGGKWTTWDGSTGGTTDVKVAT
ncbi:MAG: hypothetical protein NTX03_14720, partial [Bacteroidetes bacterium]|nr:hypothetical protein [Bacteroidota bacterium]